MTDDLSPAREGWVMLRRVDPPEFGATRPYMLWWRAQGDEIWWRMIPIDGAM